MQKVGRPSTLAFLVLGSTTRYQYRLMATEKEMQEMTAKMLKDIRETDVWTTSQEPNVPIPALYKFDDLLKDESPDFLALAIANQLRRRAGEIEYKKEESLKGQMEDIASDGLETIFGSINGNVDKAKSVTHWMHAYLLGVLTYRSKLLADSQGS